MRSTAFRRARGHEGVWWYIRIPLCLLVFIVVRTALPAQTVSIDLDPYPPAEFWRWANGEAGIALELRAAPGDTISKVDVYFRLDLDGNTVASSNRTGIVIDEVSAVLYDVEFIDVGSVDYHGSNALTGALTEQRIPAGRYRACATVFEGTEFFAEDCESFTILPTTPPQPREPSNIVLYSGTVDTLSDPDSSLDFESGDEYSLSWFAWDPPDPEPLGDGLGYRLVISQIYGRQSPLDAFRGNSPIYDRVYTDQTQVPWPTALSLPPQDTLRFVWSVQLVDSRGDPVGENDGWGRPATFMVVDLSDQTNGRFPKPNGDGGEFSRDAILFIGTDRESKKKLDPMPDWVDTCANVWLNRTTLDEREKGAADFFGVIDSIEILERREGGPNGDIAVAIGRAESDPESTAIFACKEELCLGKIVRNDTLYLLRDFGEGVHKLIRVDPSRTPATSEPLEPDSLPSDASARLYTNTDPPDRIDMLFLYSEEIAWDDEGRQEIELRTVLALEEMNEAFRLSGLDLRCEVVGIEQVESIVEGDATALLRDMHRRTDVKDTRDRTRADLVIMIAADLGPTAGQAFILRRLHPWYESHGFAVMTGDGMDLYGTLPHETGHLFGAGHECFDTATKRDSGRASWFRGYVDTAARFGTIMARQGEGRSRRLRYSDPDRTFRGSPLGNANAPCVTCNACAIDEAAILIANYRSRKPEADGVWMKDGWQDNGSEPFRPSFAEREYPWTSPYVRLGPVESEIPEHMLPRRNELVIEGPAELSVILHNDGERASGTLQLLERPTILGSTAPYRVVARQDYEMDASTSDRVTLPITVDADSLTTRIVRWLDAKSGDRRADLFAPGDDLDLLDDLVLAKNTVALSSLHFDRMVWRTDSVNASFGAIGGEGRELSIVFDRPVPEPGRAFYEQTEVHVRLEGRGSDGGELDTTIVVVDDVTDIPLPIDDQYRVTILVAHATEWLQKSQRIDAILRHEKGVVDGTAIVIETR